MAVSGSTTNPTSSPGGGGEAVLLSQETAAESGFARTLLNGEFAVTAELTPPASGAPEDLLAARRALPRTGRCAQCHRRAARDGPHVGARRRRHPGARRARADPPVHLPRPQPDRAPGRPPWRLGGRRAQRADPARRRARHQRDPAAQAGVRRGQPRFDPDRRQDARRRGARLGARDRDRAAPLHRRRGHPGRPRSPAGARPGSRARSEAGAGFVQTQLCWDIGIVRRYAAGAGGRPGSPTGCSC